MRIAMVAAKFTSEEANGLRRAMATFRNVGTIHKFESLMVDRMIDRGYDPEFARNCFEQIKGFGSYGFPESHAASFAKLVYISSWLKHHHPDVFACGLLNSQPMGFYAPAQIVGDAQKNGVTAREIDVSFSCSDNTLEELVGDYCALRLGFRQIDGLKYADPDDKDADGKQKEAEDWGRRIVDARQRRPFTSLEDFARDTALPKRALILLADADAFRSLGVDRREALWTVRRLPDDVPLPLFEAAIAREQPDEFSAALPEMPKSEHVVADYQTARLSLKGHPMEFLRESFTHEGVLSCKDATALKSGRYAKCAGVILVRQRPGSAKGVVFLTIEDETGIANIVVWPKIMERFRKEVMGARLILIEGRIQESEGVVHLVADRLSDRSNDLGHLANESLFKKRALPSGATVIEPLNVERETDPAMPAQKIRHPRNVRILPPSRDFH